MQQSQPVIVYAAAKLNLTLDITGRRSDGYHLLDMIMQTVSVYDTLLLEPTQQPSIQLSCDRAGIPCGESNTVQKAANLFYQAAGIKNKGIHIRMLKRIPDQAGMGGGSADAAAVLRAMNRFYQTSFSMEELCKIGLQVGADVPFCLRGGTLRAQGIGEILTPVPTMPGCCFVVCKPQISVSTAQAFARADQEGAAFPKYTPNMLGALKTGSLRQIASSMGNSFEYALELPEIQQLKQSLLSLGALGACMTGSGSAVFGIFSSRSQAELCRKELRKKYNQVFLCEPSAAE